MSSVADLHSITFDIANNAFQALIPVERRSAGMCADTARIMSHLAAAVDCKIMVKYLTSNEGAAMEAICRSLTKTMYGVAADGRLDVADVPLLLTAISECAHQLNSLTIKYNVALQVSKPMIIAVLQAVLLMLCEMVFTSEDYKHMKKIVESSVSVLKADIKPLAASFTWCCTPKS